MSVKLFFQAIIKYLFGVIIVGLLLFLPAGTFNYYYGWIFMGILFIPMFIAGIVLMIKDPELLKRRLNAKEEETEQKQVIIYSAIMFISGFVIAGLNYRYSWIIMPDIIVYIGTIFFLIAYLLYAVVLKENTYLARTIGVEDNQKVIETGFYGIVRHPMYSITIILFLMMPIVLNSLISLVIFLIYPFLIIKRIKNEEEVLEKELKGYKDYKKKVKYRLIPYIW